MDLELRTKEQFFKSIMMKPIPSMLMQYHEIAKKLEKEIESMIETLMSIIDPEKFRIKRYYFHLSSLNPSNSEEINPKDISTLSFSSRSSMQPSPPFLTSLPSSPPPPHSLVFPSSPIPPSSSFSLRPLSSSSRPPSSFLPPSTVFPTSFSPPAPAALFPPLPTSSLVPASVSPPSTSFQAFGLSYNKKILEEGIEKERTIDENLEEEGEEEKEQEEKEEKVEEMGKEKIIREKNCFNCLIF